MSAARVASQRSNRAAAGGPRWESSSFAGKDILLVKHVKNLAEKEWAGEFVVGSASDVGVNIIDASGEMAWLIRGLSRDFGKHGKLGNSEGQKVADLGEHCPANPIDQKNVDVHISIYRYGAKNENLEYVQSEVQANYALSFLAIAGGLFLVELAGSQKWHSM